MTPGSIRLEYLTGIGTGAQWYVRGFAGVLQLFADVLAEFDNNRVDGTACTGLVREGPTVQVFRPCRCSA